MRLIKFTVSAVLFCGLAACAPAHNVTADHAKAEREAVYFNCGETGLRAVFSPEAVSFEVEGKAYHVPQAISASGARYATPENLSPGVSFWNKGQAAYLEIDGREYPECMIVSGMDDDTVHYRALGTEPFWSVNFDRDKIAVEMLGGENQTYERSMPKLSGAAFHYKLGDDGSIIITNASPACSDGMSDRYYPDHIALEWRGRNFTGCGFALHDDGATIAAQNVTGQEWHLVSLNGAEVESQNRPTLTFGEDGRLYGNATCNRYSGSYEITGENLAIGQNIISTKMACINETLMAQEPRYLAALPAMTSAQVDGRGQLVLSGADGSRLVFTAAP